ncbi:hypothetical protein AVEN_214115-1 [Araneus ventricosus]|uniref:Uncharacterized protein n=1 Tax=Araneus ventricosus TaxID=182803 RepID=A0A4Y2C6H0_ARAVE|nr:hypothetical protein AVEN_214115-1 [Araneus ventricosus]
MRKQGKCDFLITACIHLTVWTNMSTSKRTRCISKRVLAVASRYNDEVELSYLHSDDGTYLLQERLGCGLRWLLGLHPHFENNIATNIIQLPRIFWQGRGNSFLRSDYCLYPSLR